METLGQLEILRRYPVKSMMGEDLDEVHVAFSGMVGDRVWAFVNPEKKGNFPWHTAREQHELLLYRPRFAASVPTSLQFHEAGNFAVEVDTPDDGARYRLDDPAFLERLQERAGRRFTLRFSEKSMNDERPVSIFGLTTADALTRETGREIDPRRFRANFYVRWNDPKPFFEDELVGKRLKVGSQLELLVIKKDPRCVMITLDPDTAEAHPDVLRNVAANHDGCTGVYAVVLEEGPVKRGDAIALA